MRKIITSLFCLLLSFPVWADVMWDYQERTISCDKILPVVLMLCVLLLSAGVATGVMCLFKYRSKKLLSYFFGLTFFIPPVFILTFGGVFLAFLYGATGRDAYLKGVVVFPIVWGLAGLIGSLGGLFGIKAGYGKRLWLSVAASCVAYLLVSIPLTIAYFYYLDEVC